MRFTSSAILAGLALGSSSLAAPTPVFNSPSPRLGDDVRSPLIPQSPHLGTPSIPPPARRVGGSRRSTPRYARQGRSLSEVVDKVNLHDDPVLGGGGLGIFSVADAPTVPVVKLPSDIPSPSDMVSTKDQYFPSDDAPTLPSTTLLPPSHSNLTPQQLEVIRAAVTASFEEEEQVAMAAAVLTAASSGVPIDPADLQERLATLSQVQENSRARLADATGIFDSLKPSVPVRRDVVPPDVPPVSPMAPSDDVVYEVPLDVIAVIHRLQDLLESGALDEILDAMDFPSPPDWDDASAPTDGSVAPSNSPDVGSVPMDHEAPIPGDIEKLPTSGEMPEIPALPDWGKVDEVPVPVDADDVAMVNEALESGPPFVATDGMTRRYADTNVVFHG